MGAERLGLPPAAVAMLGDRLDTDIVGAKRAGLSALMVLTGVSHEADIAGSPEKPDRVFAAVSRFGPFELHQRAVCDPAPGDGTRLQLTINTRARGPLRLLLPLLRSRFRQTMATSLQTIKQHVEAGSR